jgi:hypothetical protein
MSSQSRTLAGIQSEIVKLGKRNAASQAIDANSDKDKIARWNRDLDRIRQIFSVRSVNSAPCLAFDKSPPQIELEINNNIRLTDVHRKLMAGPEDAIGQGQSVSRAFYPSSTRC